MTDLTLPPAYGGDRNQHTSIEHWYKLFREETVDGQVKYYTSTEHIIVGQGLGTWDQFDDRHPHPTPLFQHTPNPIQKLAQQEEQFLSKGLRQVASTSGSLPLTPEGPTGTLAAIAQAITQPTAEPIPVAQAPHIPQPTITHNPTPAPTMTQVVTTTGQDLDLGETGALFGSPPFIFRGDWTKADTFLLAFKGWKAANNNKKVMVSPYTHVAVALTFIDGEDVSDWKEHELDLLNERVLNGHTKTEEYLWQEFERAFKAAFKDTSKMLNAQTKLDLLKQDKEGVERYTVTFNRLLKQAGFDEDDKGSVNLYRKGLLPGLHEAFIRHKPMPTSMKEWQEVANKEQLIFREIQHI